MTASSSASWSRFSPPSNFVNGHVSTMVCRWLQSQEGDLARPHLCNLARHGSWPVRKRFIRDHVWWGRSKPGCRIVGSVAVVWLTTEADDQSSLHCVTVLTDVMSDHIGRQDASCGPQRHQHTQASLDGLRWCQLLLYDVVGGATLLSSHESCVCSRQPEIRHIALWSWVSMRVV